MPQRIIAFLIAFFLVSPVLNAAEVNVYSARKEVLLKPLLQQFTEETGIAVNLVSGKADALIARLQQEKMLSPADVLISTDVGRLARAKQLNLTQPIALNNYTLNRFDDPDAHWIALTKRVRPIVVNPTNVDITALQSYEDLAKPEYQGRICVRSSNNIYNQSMVAAMIIQEGEKATLSWMKGLVANFARQPKGGDRDQIKAVVKGECDIALVNTYYLAAMLNADSDTKAIAEQVQVVWPNQQDRGVHMNISGISIAKFAKNKDSAKALIEFMLTPEAQQWYSQSNQEYPVVDGVELSSTLTAMGRFKAETIELEKVGTYNAQAIKLMDRAGWR